LGLIIDFIRRFIAIKLMYLYRKYKLLLRLLYNRSTLTLNNKVLIYNNTILKPTWTYGIELWGSTKPLNTNRIQTLQSIILRKITNAPFYVTNQTLHNDLNIPFIRDQAVPPITASIKTPTPSQPFSTNPCNPFPSKSPS
jgi:hypothetical protein